MGSTENVGTTSQGSVSTVTPSRTSSPSTTASAGASSADKTVPPPSKDSQQQNMSSQSSSSSLTDTSVETPSPPSILRSSPSFTLSPSSSQTRLSFAPLPEIAPRKRNSSMQLGVAARSRMIQQRRMMMQPQAPMTAEEFEDEYGYSPPLGYDPQIWNDERLRDPGLAEEAVDDAIAAFGRMMKDAGKTLWRKVSMKKLKEKDEADEEDPDAAEEDRRTELAKKARKKRAPRPAYAPVTNTQTPRVLSEKDENATTKRQPPLPAKPQETKPAKASTADQKAESEASSETPSLPRPSAEEEGGVWEEEVSEEFKHRLVTLTANSRSGSPSLPPTPTTEKSQSELQGAVISVKTTVQAMGSIRRKNK